MKISVYRFIAGRKIDGHPSRRSDIAIVTFEVAAICWRKINLSFSLLTYHTYIT